MATPAIDALHDEAIAATTEFLDAVKAVSFDTEGQACPDSNFPDAIGRKLEAATNACRKLVESYPDKEALALFDILRQMTTQFVDYGPCLYHDGEVWVGGSASTLPPIREVWMGMVPVDEARRLRDSIRDAPRTPMTHGQKDVWTALNSRSLPSTELAAELDTSVETIRQHAMDLRRAGYRILRRPGRGYYRPDAPPEEMQTHSRNAST